MLLEGRPEAIRICDVCSAAGGHAVGHLVDDGRCRSIEGDLGARG